jgi:quinol monooxygenase YgiN
VIVVLGSVLIRDGSVADALIASQEHVERSRKEPGCLEHGLSIDAQVPNRLVFVERWASMEALRAHFAVPASRAFVKGLAALAAQAPTMVLYEATEVHSNGKSAA